MPPLTFQITHRSRSTAARTGVVQTAHGSFQTPAFMPVGTRGTVRGVLPDQVASTGSEILLGNTYHLWLRPGPEVVAGLGGLHRFMGWERPILTDSGGYQAFSLATGVVPDDEGVTFRSHLDGKSMRLDPARCMEIQNLLGADIVMSLDDCPPAKREAEVQSPKSKVQSQETEVQSLRSKVQSQADNVGTPAMDETSEVRQRRANALDPAQYDARNRLAVRRTFQWLQACMKAHRRKSDQSLFGIVQGGSDLELRSECAKTLSELDLPGYAIGGVAVGESPQLMWQVVRHTGPLLPEDRPRYLMGVGYERDIFEAVRSGIDMFDCVLPTRNGRNGLAFTRTGPFHVRNVEHAQVSGPLDPACDCLACMRFTRGYLRHLFAVGEMLGPILLSLHNLRHFQRLMLDIRCAIRDDNWSALSQKWPVLQVA